LIKIIVQKKKIIEKLGLNGNAVRLRLVHKGKLIEIAENKSLISQGVTDNSILHAAIADYSSIQLHQELYQNIEQPVERRGFDRLRELGFTEVEIEEFRAQFYSSRLPSMNSTTNVQEEEDWINSTVDEMTPHTHEEMRQQEQQHIQEEGTYEDLVYGMLMGFWLGLIMLFFLFDSSLPRKTKYGILAGIGCNLSFGILRGN